MCFRGRLYVYINKKMAVNTQHEIIYTVGRYETKLPAVATIITLPSPNNQ